MKSILSSSPRVGFSWRSAILAASLLIPFASADAASHRGRSHLGRHVFAQAQLKPTQGNKATGTVTFSRVGDKVTVHAKIAHVTPGPHGIHIHQIGDCSARDASSAGAHWAPAGHLRHGAPNEPGTHPGDMGNIIAGPNGEGKLTLAIKQDFKGWNKIIGKSVVLHAGKDDLHSQPAGNSGGRIACGVIKRATSGVSH